MKKKIEVSVSTLPAKENILIYAKKLENIADSLHCDFMDATITKSKSYLDMNLIKQIRQNTNIKIDVHLMCKNPKQYIKKLIGLNIQTVFIQFEAFENNSQLLDCLNYVKENNIKVGLAIDYLTDVEKVVPYLSLCDKILVMSVNIGASGQKFGDRAVDKIKFLNNLHSSGKYEIEVDGGINNFNCGNIISAGADILVSGSYVFNDINYQFAINSLKNNF